MPRNKTDTVEYFPHIAKSGKTLSILEGKHGNDGYSFWFKLLEILSLSDGHFYDCSDEIDWQYLISRSHLSDVSATEIINLLCIMRQIDADLWKNHKIIWCQGLVDNFQEVYRKRKRDLPIKPNFDNCDRNRDNCDRNRDNSTVSAPESTQSKVEESKEKESTNPPTPQRGNGVPVEFENFWSLYPKKIGKQAAVKKWKTLKRSGQLPPLQQIIEAVENQKTWEQWQKDGGQFIPHPETWLNQGRWEDKPTEGGQPQWTRELSKQPSTN